MSSAPGPARSRPAIRNALDITAALAMVIASLVVVWVAFRDNTIDAPAVPAPVLLSLEGINTRGSADSGVVMVEVADFQCPFCARFAIEVLPTIEKRYVDSGKVILAFRHFPIERIHPLAQSAAQAAYCAGRQGAFWKLRELFFFDLGQLTDDRMSAQAASLGLDSSEFSRCAEQEAPGAVNADMVWARSAGVRVTPTLLLGARVESRRMRVLDVIEGVPTVEHLSQRLDRVIRQAERR